MGKKLTFIALYIIVYCFSYSYSYAWGLTGHRVVAEIADSYLTKKARKNLNKILGNESLAMSANWPDFIKSDPNFRYLNSWHYVNFKSGQNFDLLKQSLATDTTANAYNKLLMLIDELKRHPSIEKETALMYVRLLVHIVGDIHQPMHTGRLADLGGNKINLYWFGNPTNLHRVWDEQLIDYQQLSYTEYAKAINFVDKQQRQLWTSSPIEQWLFESYTLTESLYTKVSDGDKLSYRYNFDNVEILNQQLLKGGVRLAGLLNDIFG